jgi:hypothetical protein
MSSLRIGMKLSRLCCGISENKSDDKQISCKISKNKNIKYKRQRKKPFEQQASSKNHQRKKPFEQQAMMDNKKRSSKNPSLLKPCASTHNENKPKGLIHQPISNKSVNCIMAKVMQSFHDYKMDEINNNSSILSSRAQTKKNNKDKKLLGYKTAQRGICQKEDAIKNTKYYYIFYEDDYPLYTFRNKIQQNFDDYKFIKLEASDMKMNDSLDGLILYDKNNKYPIFIKPPREKVLNTKVNASRDVYYLKALIGNKSIDGRGSKRTGICKGYSTLGLHANRNSVGMHIKKILAKFAKEEDHLKKMIDRAERYAREFLPFGILSNHETVKELCDSKFHWIDIPEGRSDYSAIYSSVATSINYISHTHTDEDGMLSCLFVSFTELSEYKKTGDLYKEDMPIAVYFCFPGEGVAVGLRPGDILFFHPLHLHNASQRTEHYKEKDILLTSFYVKSKEITGNNNSIELKDSFMEECERIDKIMNKNYIEMLHQIKNKKK